MIEYHNALTVRAEILGSMWSKRRTRDCDVAGHGGEPYTPQQIWDIGERIGGGRDDH
jgi:hypothetical protein